MFSERLSEIPGLRTPVAYVKGCRSLGVEGAAPTRSRRSPLRCVETSTSSEGRRIKGKPAAASSVPASREARGLLSRSAKSISLSSAAEPTL